MKPPDAQEGRGAEAPELSVVLPVYDEQESLGGLYREIRDALGWTTWEIVAVDDGSRDGSVDLLMRLATGDPRVRVLSFGGNRGQTAAMLAGMRAARGRLVVTMDADGQNDPADVRTLHDALGEHDAVVGVRANRRDGFVRRASSKIANAVRNRLSGDRVTDTGCSLKLFRREVVADLPAYSGMHRFLPTLLRMAGHDVVEADVGHRPRSEGTSKYGIRNRLLPSFLDLLAVCWMRRRRVELDVRELEPLRGGEGAAPKAAAAETAPTTTSARS